MEFIRINFRNQILQSVNNPRFMITSSNIQTTSNMLLLKIGLLRIHYIKSITNLSMKN